MTPRPNPQSPPSHQPQEGLSNAATGGPGAAGPNEQAETPWVQVRRQVPQPHLPTDRVVLPVRAIEGAYGFAGVSAILDARDRTVAMIITSEAAAWVKWRNGRGV